MAAPKLSGPRHVEALRLIRDRGPLTPRQVGQILFPSTDSVEMRNAANRGAGAIVGMLARGGWVEPLPGERYAIAYQITASGRAELGRAVALVEADPVVEADAKLPRGRKRCSRCHRARALAMFYRERAGSGKRHTHCRFCHLDKQAEKRSAVIADRDLALPWTRASKAVLIRRTVALLRAAREARRAGMWRGRDGIRAYAALGEALDIFGADHDLKLIRSEATDPAPSRLEHADPRDADWSAEAHTNAGHFGRG